MEGCGISLNPYKHWENWHSRCEKIEILAVGIGCTGELSLSVGCEPSLAGR